MKRMTRAAKAKTPKKAAIDRPFDAKVWAEAERVAAQYHVLLWQADGEWYGRSLELATVFSDGPTAAECVANTLEALATAVAFLLESGRQPPTPAQEGARTEQVNVRLSAEEKLALEVSAKHRGFKGLSDFIRAAAVEYTR